MPKSNWCEVAKESVEPEVWPSSCMHDLWLKYLTKLEGNHSQQRSLSLSSLEDCYLLGAIAYVPSHCLVSLDGAQLILFWNDSFPVLSQVCHLDSLCTHPSQWEFEEQDRISLHLSVRSVLWNTQHTSMCTSSALLLINHVPGGHP